jgi:hypothetical protein
MAESALGNSFKEWQSHHQLKVPADLGPINIKIKGKPPIKKTIVPVIYIPGIFGSRLENTGASDEKKRFVWDVDENKKLMSTYASIPSMIASGFWSDDEIEQKTKRMHGSAVVMTGHDDKVRKKVISAIQSSDTFRRLKDFRDRNAAFCNSSTHLPNDTQLAELEYDRRSKRGWYGVWNKYNPLLEAINGLNDPEFNYPVYAFGYDWRFDLDKAADKLVTKINDVLAIQDYPDFGERGKHYEKIHTKVIIVTHSQGSLVARYAMKVNNPVTKVPAAEAKVQAVVHLDQPTTGAPVLYQRFITGLSPERSLLTPFDNVFDEILGGTPYHFTSMAAKLTGALTLLPTNDFVAKAGDAKHQWLNSNHPHLSFDKPVTDVYDDVYLSEKFGLINCKRYDAAGQPKPYQEKEFETVQYFDESKGDNSVRIVRVPRQTFGDGPLPAGATISAPEDNPYRRDNHRLRPHVELDEDTYKFADDFWNKVVTNINTAKEFHTNLKLAQHKDTHVVRARGVKTVTQVTFNLNDKGVLDCPLLRTADGDGTVPLTSQEALLQAEAKPAGKIIEGGAHAEICGHPEAMQQVKDLLTGAFVAVLRTQSQGKSA